MNAWLKYSDFVCFFKRCNFKRNYYASIEPRTTLSYTCLSKDGKPIHYKILLSPNLVTYEFSGDETITIFVEETTSVVCVNSHN
uniref:ZP domain-containing protein n=1 Tax=Parastrongyloides trichosuri TaxID=131310 RepID=A0A0N4Z862_PARTI